MELTWTPTDAVHESLEEGVSLQGLAVSHAGANVFLCPRQHGQDYPMRRLLGVVESIDAHMAPPSHFLGCGQDDRAQGLVRPRRLNGAEDAPLPIARIELPFAPLVLARQEHHDAAQLLAHVFEQVVANVVLGTIE